MPRRKLSLSVTDKRAANMPNIIVATLTTDTAVSAEKMSDRTSCGKAEKPSPKEAIINKAPVLT